MVDFLVDGLFEVPTAIRNVPLQGDSAGKPFVMTFEFPIRAVGFYISNGEASTRVVVRAFAPTGDLLGTIEETGADHPSGELPARDRFIGFRTPDPRGVSRVVIDYGEDPAAEEINTWLGVEYASPLRFRRDLPQIGYGKVGPFLLTTTIQVQSLYGTGQARLELFDPEGNPIELSLNGEQSAVFEFGIPTGELVTDGPGADVRVAHGWLEADRPIAAYVVYSLSNEGDLVPSVQAGISSAEGSIRNVVSLKKIAEMNLDTAIAIANLSDTETRVRFSLAANPPEQLDEIVNDPAIRLPPRAQRAFFLGQLCDIAVPPPGLTYCRSNFLENADFLGQAFVYSEQPVAITTVRTVGGLPVLSLPVDGLNQ